MITEGRKEHYGWVLVPSIVAFAAVLGVEVAFATGTLGSQYNATIVWDSWSLDTNIFITCEEENENVFVRRPISAVFSVCYVLAGIFMFAYSVIDVARSPRYRNLHVLMEREPWWGPILGAGPLALAAVNFLAFSSSRSFLFILIHWIWWCTFNHFAAYAWTRLLQEGFKCGRCWRNSSDVEDENVMHIDEVNDEEAKQKQKVIKEVVLSITSTACIGAAAGFDFLLYILRNRIIENQVQDLLIFILICVGLVPTYLHWRLKRDVIRVRWWRLSLAAALGLGSLALLQGDFSLSLCRSPKSVFQPFAGFELISSLAIIVTYFFFRGDLHQARYMVIVQVDHRLDQQPGVVAAFFVPEDDPYRSQRQVAHAVPAEAPIVTATATRAGRADSSDSNSSSRRRSSAQVDPVTGRLVTERRPTLQEVSVANGTALTDRRNTPAGIREPQGRSPSQTGEELIGGGIFAAAGRVEGSTSSRTSQDSAGARRNQLKQRPPGTLGRDGSVEFSGAGRARPQSLDRRIQMEDQDPRRSSSDRRVSSAAAEDVARPRVPSAERRLEPRPRAVERSGMAPIGDPTSTAGSTRSINAGGRASLVAAQPRSSSLERGFLDNGVAGGNGRGSITLNQGGGRPSSSSFDQYATAPIVAAVPITQVSARNSNSSSATGSTAAALATKPRPPSLTSEGSAGSFRSGGAITSSTTQGDIPVIVARSRGTSTEPRALDAAARRAPTPPPAAAASLQRPTPPGPPAPQQSLTPTSSITFGPGVNAPASTAATGSTRASSVTFATGNITLSSAAAPTGSRPSVVSPPPGLNGPSPANSRAPSITQTTVPLRRPTAPPVPDSLIPPPPPLPVPVSRPSLQVDAGQRSMMPVGIPVEERRPMASSFDSTASSRRPPAGSFDSASGRGSGRPSGVVPGRTRRSSIDREENPALRALNVGRSVESERNIAGQAIDSRKVALRTPEEALEASRRLSIGTFDEDDAAPPPQANMSTTERLAALRAERARLEQARQALQQKRNNNG